MTTELWRNGASELAALIARREVSATEVVTAHLARIAQVNPQLNAVVRVLADEALAAAATADRAQGAGQPLGPLHGVPFTVKENIDVAGTPTTQAMKPLAAAVVTEDAPIVARMRAAGAIVIGRTNLPDMGLRIHTDSSLHGLTRNPWHAGRTAGGSSGGEASALASGMSPIGLGNDIGGSLRNPAHCCGVASIKPSQNRVPAGMTVPSPDPFLAAQLMATDGPMARRVADVRLGLRIIVGQSGWSPFIAPVPLDGMGPQSGRLRVAVMSDPPGGSTAANVIVGVERAAAALAAAGHFVTVTMPPLYTEAIESWGGLLMTEIAGMLPMIAPLMGADALSFLEAALEGIPALTADAYALNHITRHAIARAWVAFFADYDVLLSPVWTQQAFEHGADLGGVEAAMNTLDLLRPVLPANLLGLPAAVVPAGVYDGLPSGVQIIAPLWHDLTALYAAEEIENALGTITPIDPRT